MTQSSRRPLVGGVLAATAVLSAGLVSGCSAGQIAQTAQVEPGVAGLNTQAPDRKVYLRNAVVDYAGPKGYAKGDKAPLTLWLFNNTTSPVVLTRVDVFRLASPGPDQPGENPQAVPVAQVGLASGANTAAPCAVPRSAPPSAPATSAPPSSAPASASAKASGSASASAPAKSASPSVASSPSVEPSPSQTGPVALNLTVPALGCLELSPRAAQYLQVLALSEALDNTGTLQGVVFNFTDSAGRGFTIGTTREPLAVPLAVPESALPRGK